MKDKHRKDHDMEIKIERNEIRGNIVHTVSYGAKDERGFFQGKMLCQIQEETFLDPEHRAALDAFLMRVRAMEEWAAGWSGSMEK